MLTMRRISLLLSAIMLTGVTLPSAATARSAASTDSTCMCEAGFALQEKSATRKPAPSDPNDGGKIVAKPARK
jgi:hypothetical protein